LTTAPLAIGRHLKTTTATRIPRRRRQAAIANDAELDQQEANRSALTKPAQQGVEINEWQ